MPGYARICPDMPGICPDDVQLFPVMSRCHVCPATALRAASGPTIRLSRAAERATIKRHGIIKEYMFVNRRGRRRLQAAVGPGHGRRRAFGSPDHEYGRDTEVADTGRDTTRRDPATSHTARDPATGDTARDGPPSRRDRRRAIRHATALPHAVTGDGRYGT